MNKTDLNQAQIKYFSETEEAKRLLEACTGDLFLNEICRKYHYPADEKKTLVMVSQKMQESMLKEAAFSWHMTNDHSPKTACVVITLGEGIDRIQENFSQEQKLTENYMAEVISAEFLLKSYPVCNLEIQRNSAFTVERYRFIGSSPEFGIEELPVMLAESGLNVSCNSAFYMIPKKSVAFYALLTKDASVPCPGICVGCKSRGCPNRIHENDEKIGRSTDLLGVAFNYGYSRIFGRNYQ